MIKLGVSGALGKMGRRILTLAAADPAFKIALALERQGHPQLGERFLDLEVVSSCETIQVIDGLIEFSSPEATLEHLRCAHSFKKAMVIGTTGISEDEKEVIAEAARDIPIVFSPNMSIGVNLLFGLVREAVGKLSKDYSVSIVEAHHVHKKDSPSGTAKHLAGIIREERKGEEAAVRAIREGEIVGDHEVIFESGFDTIKLAHHAKTRDIFATGALEAMKFVVSQKAGLYTMADVINAR